MIDKNGKLFGKINIIDLLIILVIIAAAVFLVVKMGGSDTDTGSAVTGKVAITFFGNEAPSEIDGKINIGDPAYEDTTNIGFGTVIDCTVEDAYKWGAAADGTVVKVPVVNTAFATVTVEADAVITDSGVVLGDKTYSIGAQYAMHFGQTKVWARLTDISPVE